LAFSFQLVNILGVPLYNRCWSTVAS
jgi:hypothetical protein